MNTSIKKEHAKNQPLILLYDKYKHGFLLLYLLLYFPWFAYLEKTVTTRFHVIHMTIDELIPFCEYFIIPYLAWFPFVAFAVLFFFFTDKGDYYKLCAFLFIGMTIFLLISTVYPNGAHLRPETFTNDNIFISMVKQLYSIDTPTNLFPSIHVYNSIGVTIAVFHSKQLASKKWIRYSTLGMAILIILSTMFLKQHSVFDVLTAFVMSVFLHTFVYARGTQTQEHFVDEGSYQNG